MRKFLFLVFILFFLSTNTDAQITREFEIKVTDSGLYFDGEKRTTDKHIDESGFEYYFGRRITPHGDCIKKYGDFLFLTWYLGGEENKNIMLSRLHIPTQTLETIKFDHTHVGYQHKYTHIGDSHNTIAVGICPLDSTVHLLYDMHSYSQASYPESFFNYQVSLKGAANVPVGSFTKELFNPRQTYMNSAYNYSDITYPNFFLNTKNELFVWFREGGNNNGKYKFAKYDGENWGPFTNFSTLNAKGQGNDYNWGLYGDLKYINGKLRVGFLKRMSYNDDKYVYNNGFHYAYTNDPEGKTDWYNFKDESFSLPLINPEKIFFHEPGDAVTQGGANSITISSGTDFTVTDTEAVHFITNNVRSNVDGSKANVHAYKKEGDTEFTISTDFPGGNLYAIDGNQVYLISQYNNRPEIFRALGGTNDWEKLHTETTGIRMEHSNVLIADDKLFVYAMEKSSGDARPIYIQMYNLDVAPIDTSRYIEYNNLTDGMEIEKGSNLTIEANIGSAYEEVSLWHGSTNLGTLTSAPYSWSGHDVLTNMEDPTYTFKIIAKDSIGVEDVSSITITVISKGLPVVDVSAMIDKLIFYCPLEMDGTDLSGSENNATPGSGVTFNAGKVGNAASFNFKEGSYLTTADSIYKYNHQTAYTIAFWLKVDKYGERGDIMQPVGGRTLLYSNGDLNFRTYHQKQLAIFSVSEEEKNEWMHVTMVIDQREGQTMHKFYVNGEQRGSEQSGYELESDKPQSIGRIIFGAASDEAISRNFTGMLDELYMFNEILTENEIVYLMNTTNLIDAGTPPEAKPVVAAYFNFEDEATAPNWELEANKAYAEIVDYEGSRTGTKVFKVTNFERNTGFHYTNNSGQFIEAKPGEYIHSIIHAACKESGGQIAPSFSSEWVSITPGFKSLDTLVVKRFTSNKQYPDGETSNLPVYPRLRTKPGVVTNEIYIDDLILYAHSSSVTDIVAPKPANGVSTLKTASSNLLGWIEGIDTLTGVQITYVLRTENNDPVAPVLLPQVKYSVNGGVEGPNTIGEWSIIATVDAGVASYTDESIVDESMYRYAIVHGDLAFNNSEAVLDTEVEVIPPTLSNVSTNVEKGDNILATSNKNGKIYLVTKGEYNILSEVIAAKIIEKDVTANNPVSISTTDRSLGDYLIFASDPDGIMSAPSSVISITDNIAPTFTSLVIIDGSISGTSAAISFIATDNDAIEEYEIYLGNDLVSATNSNTFIFEGLQFGTDYEFGVVAIDKAGNESEKSTISATTILPSILGCELIDATKDEKISDLTDGMSVYVTNETNNLNIRVLTDPEPLYEGLNVLMEVSGDFTHSTTEGGAPYALWGDNVGDYNNHYMDTGFYALQVVIIDDTKEITEPVSISFMVADSTSDYVSVKALSDKDISVYPVPVQTILHISGINKGAAEIYNASGKIVARFTEFSNGMNVSNLTRGLYLVRISNKNGVISTQRFIKE